MSDMSGNDDMSNMGEPQSEMVGAKPKLGTWEHQVDTPSRRYPVVSFVNQVHTASAPAPEHYELIGAIRNIWTNPGRSEISDVHVNKRYFKIMLKKLCSAVPAVYGDSQQPTIYMVPQELYNSGYDARGEYEPVAVCLGSRNSKIGGLPPCKYKESLVQFDKYKWCCVRQLISRHCTLLEPARTVVLLDRCFTSMKRLLPQIQASYSQGTLRTSGSHPEDEVAEMMLLDGCFILHRLLKYARRAKMEADGYRDQFDEDGYEDWTQVYGRCGVWQLVTRDLLLLENQIPFSVIRNLFQQLRNEDEPEELLVTGSLRLFRSLRPQMLHRSHIACNKVHHLLHLFYLSVSLPPSQRQQQHWHRQSDALLPELPQWIPCAKELEEAGIRFRKRSNARSFLDIVFARGVLEIPQLELNDSSESLLRNLIAFEQTYPDTPRDISTYAVFMNCLITSPEDMRILDLHGILVNHLNSRRDVVWRFFSDIVTRVHWSTDNYLVDLMGAVNRYRDSRRHKWRAALVRNYFSNPWVTMSVLAALVLLAMSVLQTFFAVYAYFKPPK